MTSGLRLGSVSLCSCCFIQVQPLRQTGSQENAAQGQLEQEVSHGKSVFGSSRNCAAIWLYLPLPLRKQEAGAAHCHLEDLDLE